jgi:monofunctional biosynthetic peptidoglycan transglycosylase
VALESTTLFAGLVVIVSTMHVPLDATPWLNINDVVMGGVSTGQVRDEDGVLVFSGQLSLENRGGFASVRRPVDPPPDDTVLLRLEVRGDGRRYQFRIRQDTRFDGAAWRQFFTASASWQVIELPLAGFEPVFRGTPIAGAGPVEAKRIQQIGFMLADKQAGPFRLEIRSIEFIGPERQPDERN